MSYKESPVELPRPADSKVLGSPSLVGFGLASRLSISFICSMVPVSSWNCPSMELIRVLSVETEPIDLSSDIEDGLGECVIERGTANGDLMGEGV